MWKHFSFSRGCVGLVLLSVSPSLVGCHGQRSPAAPAPAAGARAVGVAPLQQSPQYHYLFVYQFVCPYEYQSTFLHISGRVVHRRNILPLWLKVDVPATQMTKLSNHQFFRCMA